MNVESAEREQNRVRASRIIVLQMHSTLDVHSLDFQNCRLADPPESAGREAALEVGLEICAEANNWPDRFRT